MSGRMPGQQSGLYTHPQVGRGASRQPAPQSSLSLSIFNVPANKRNLFHAFQ